MKILKKQKVLAIIAWKNLNSTWPSRLPLLVREGLKKKWKKCGIFHTWVDSFTSGNGDQVVCQASAPFLCSSSWSPSWWTPPSPPSTTTSWRSRWSAESSSANTYSVIISFYHVIPCDIELRSRVRSPDNCRVGSCFIPNSNVGGRQEISEVTPGCVGGVSCEVSGATRNFEIFINLSGYSSANWTSGPLIKYSQFSLTNWVEAFQTQMRRRNTLKYLTCEKSQLCLECKCLHCRGEQVQLVELQRR